MNISVYTDREDYNRQRNLKLVCEAVRRHWGVELQINNRNDIIYQQKKVIILYDAKTKTTEH